MGVCSFCWDVLFGVVHALQPLAHTTDVYVDLVHPEKLGSLQTTSPDVILQTFHTRPLQDMKQLANASKDYDLIVYIDWYSPEAHGQPDTTLRGETYFASSPYQHVSLQSLVNSLMPAAAATWLSYHANATLA